MKDKSLLESLPIELVQQVSSFLDYKSIVGSSKASKACQGLFNNALIWKYQLKKEFGIEHEQFAKLEKKIIDKANYKKIYARLNYLIQQRNLLTFIKDIYRDKSQHDLVLLACTDDVTCLEEMTREQQYTIAVLATFMGCFNFPTEFLEKQNDGSLAKNLLEHAARSGNFELAQYLLNPENQFELKPNWTVLNCAVRSGSFQLVQYLLNPENNFELKRDTGTLDSAAYSGNLQLVQYLQNTFKLEPNDNTLDYAAESDNLHLLQYLMSTFGLKPNNSTLCAAARSGNLQLMQYLLNAENKFELEPDDETLKAAAVSGHLQLVQYLLNTFKLKPDDDTLDCAAKSGNLQLMQYLLNLENKFELEPDDETLKAAAASGHLQLVQYLVNTFKLEPDDDTLDCATQSGNLQLVQYLLNNFEIKPDTSALESAASSGNLLLVQYLLHPNYQISFKGRPFLSINSVSSRNYALSHYLLPSHVAFQNALQQLQDHDLDAAKASLKKSHTACPSHYMMMSKYILDNPQRFNLNDEAIQCLKAKILPNPPFSKEGIKKRFLEDAETPDSKRRP